MENKNIILVKFTNNFSQTEDITSISMICFIGKKKYIYDMYKDVQKPNYSRYHINMKCDQIRNRLIIY